MTNAADADIPESGAVFTLGKSKFADNDPSHFFIKNDPVVAISCGDEHTAVICNQGRVFVFGANESGQLGLGHTETVTRPSCVKWLKPHRTLSVACGRSHTVFLTENDHIYTTGNNSDGQLGTGNTENQTVPQYIEIDIPDLKIKQISAGSCHTAILTDTGRALVCGSNNEGQLGLGENVKTATVLTEIELGRTVTFIECGAYFTVFITDGGDVYVCGENDNQKLGIANPAKYVFKPEQVTLDVPIKSSCCGSSHAFLLSVDESRVYAFGSNEYGQLGLPKVVVEVTAPTEVSWDKLFDGSAVKLVACGATHTAFVTESGQLYTCGDSRHGKLGLEDSDDDSNQYIPKRLTILEDYVVDNVACGGCHTILTAAKTPRSTHSNVTMLKELPPLKVPAALMNKLEEDEQNNSTEPEIKPVTESPKTEHLNGHSEEEKSIDSLEANVSDSHIVEINKIEEDQLPAPNLERQDKILEVHIEQKGKTEEKHKSPVEQNSLSIQNESKGSPELSPKSVYSQKSDYSKSENETIICYSDKSSPQNTKTTKTTQAVIPIVRAEDSLHSLQMIEPAATDDMEVTTAKTVEKSRFSNFFQSIRDKENSCMGKGKAISSVNIKETVDSGIDKVEDKVTKTEDAVQAEIINQTNSRACIIL